MADFRDSKGGIYKPTGPIKQHIGDTYINLHQTEKFPLPHQIPPPSRNFTGREEIIDQILTGFNQGDTVVCLRGTGGLGKTALAYMLADLLRDRYKDGQLMVKLQGTSPNPLTPAQAMSKLLRYYYPSASLPENEEELQSLYLSTLDGKCVLVLMDNALDDHQVRPLLLPATCGLIITSRHKFALSGMVPIDLDILKLEDAVEFLLKTARTHSSKPLPQEESAWKEIARMCGCLPVALKAAGSYLVCTPGSSPTQYVKELRDERKRLGIIGKEGVEEDLVTKLSLSYNRLLPETAQVFRLLSVFPADFDAAAEEVVCQDEGHRHLSELVRWSLVEYQKPGEEGKGRYHLHDLVRIFAASRLQAGEEVQAQQRHSEHYRIVLSASDELYKQGGENILAGLGLFDLEWSNIQAGQSWAKKNMEENSSAVELCKSYPEAGAYVLDLRLHPGEQITWLKWGVEAARRSKDKMLEGVHLGSLGSAYYYLGDAKKAVELFEQRLDIAREIGDRRGEGAALGNLGNAYAVLAMPKKAIELFEQRLDIARDIGDRRGEGNALGNLGNAHADLGDAKKGIEFFEQHLDIAREIRDRRSEGNALGSLGNVYTHLGDAKKAIEFHESALAIAREIGDRKAEEAALGSLGICCARLGDAKKAIEYYKQALVISREIGDRKGEGAALGNLGLACSDLGGAKKAIEYYEQHLAIAHKIGDRRGEGNALWNISRALHKLDERSEAINKAESALKIYEQIESPMAAPVRQQLAKWKE